jgi:hypothetical protein
VELERGQDGRPIVVPRSEELPSELRLLTNEHYILNESDKPWKWDKLARSLVETIRSDFMASNTGNYRSTASTTILVSNIQSNAASLANYKHKTFIGLSGAITNIAASNG